MLNKLTHHYFEASLCNRARRSLTRPCASSLSGSSVCRVDRRVEGFSLPLDHGFIVHAIGIFRSLDISFAQKHVGSGLIGIRLREPFGQREQLIGDPVRIAEFAGPSLPGQCADAVAASSSSRSRESGCDRGRTSWHRI